MSPRSCSCGCGRSLEGRRQGVIYFDGACKQRAYRSKVTRALVARGLPASLSLKTAEVTNRTSTGNGDRPARGSARLRLTRAASKDPMADKLARYDAMQELKRTPLHQHKVLARLGGRIQKLSRRLDAYEAYLEKYGAPPHPAELPSSRAA